VSRTRESTNLNRCGLMNQVYRYMGTRQVPLCSKAT
jgi:hypothetical protein